MIWVVFLLPQEPAPQGIQLGPVPVLGIKQDFALEGNGLVQVAPRLVVYLGPRKTRLRTLPVLLV
jgi:hypothetical protein